MRRVYEAPVLHRYGPIAEITASDYKCTPGGDGGFAIWSHTIVGTDEFWTNIETNEQTPLNVTPLRHTLADCKTGDFF